jgi:hypothetical protein
MDASANPNQYKQYQSVKLLFLLDFDGSIGKNKEKILVCPDL